MIRNARVKVSAALIEDLFKCGCRCADIVSGRLPDDAVLLRAYDDLDGHVVFVFQSELFGDDGDQTFDLEPTFTVPDGCARPVHVVIGG